MRTTDDRYAGERAQFDLAIRLIHHQARTHIITRCTGFTQDRIRKLYATYFKHREDRPVSRHRGKSPSSVEFFVRNPWVQAEASLLAHLFAAWGLLRILPDLATEAAGVADHLSFGQRLCDAYEAFRSAHPHSRITFEHAWSLLQALSGRDDLLLLDCGECSAFYVQDALALDGRRCPACRVGAKLRVARGTVADGQANC
jgi:hypothetical protein